MLHNNKQLSTQLNMGSNNNKNDLSNFYTQIHAHAGKNRSKMKCEYLASGTDYVHSNGKMYH